MQHNKEENALSDKEIIDALHYESYLNNKRAENEKFEVKYDFGKCRICSDDSTGIHYGAFTCESCKVYFHLIILVFSINNFPNRILKIKLKFIIHLKIL